MRVRLAIGAWLVACGAIALFAWYQGRPRHFIVQGGTMRVGVISKADPSACIISHHAVVENYPAGMGLTIRAQVRDIRGATIRCAFADDPRAGGTDMLKGDSRVGTTQIAWTSTSIDRATLLGCILGLRPAPRYTLDYTTPRSNGWSVFSMTALLAGPVVIVAARVVAKHPLHRRSAARRGFEVTPMPPSRT
jgi:hypothetical protein